MNEVETFTYLVPQLFGLFIKYCGRSGARIPADALDFLALNMSRQTLGPSQPPVKWVSGSFSREVELPGREFDHFHLVPMSRMTGALLLFSSTLSCRGQGQLYPFLLIKRSVLGWNYSMCIIVDYVIRNFRL